MDDSRLLEDYFIRSRWPNWLQMAIFGLTRVYTSTSNVSTLIAIRSWCLDAYLSDDTPVRKHASSFLLPLERLFATRVPQNATVRHGRTTETRRIICEQYTFWNYPKTVTRKISERLKNRRRKSRTSEDKFSSSIHTNSVTFIDLYQIRKFSRKFSNS